MDSITIWADRPSGIDPTAHLWFMHVDTGIPHRLCDGAIWTEGQEVDDEPAPFVSCCPCKETYVVDVLHGRKLLAISSEGPSPIENGPTPVDTRPTPVDLRSSQVENGVHYLEQGGAAMPVHRVSVFNFAKFCEAKAHRQESVVRQMRKRSLTEGFDYYGPLKHLLRKTHWANNKLVPGQCETDG